MTPVRLEPAAPRSRVKHSTIEPQRSLIALSVKITCMCEVGVSFNRSSLSFETAFKWLPYFQSVDDNFNPKDGKLFLKAYTCKI